MAGAIMMMMTMVEIGRIGRKNTCMLQYQLSDDIVLYIQKRFSYVTGHSNGFVSEQNLFLAIETLLIIMEHVEEFGM